MKALRWTVGILAMIGLVSIIVGVMVLVSIISSVVWIAILGGLVSTVVYVSIKETFARRGDRRKSS